MPTIEIDDSQLDTVHELILRGLTDSEELTEEQLQAYDNFCDAAGYPLRIGDQPENVQAVWDDLLSDAASPC